jgi:hypothetical protein
MVKRDSGGRQGKAADNTAPAPDAATNDVMERRVIAFAEQLGRISGTVMAKADGWMDREALNQQIASVRDSAVELLQQLSEGVTNLTGMASKPAKTAAVPATGKGRSGGVVDAPGKKHRKPVPKDTRAIVAAAKRSTMRSGAASMKTMKKRGRG